MIFVHPLGPSLSVIVADCGDKTHTVTPSKDRSFCHKSQAYTSIIGADKCIATHGCCRSNNMRWIIQVRRGVLR